MRCGLGTIIWGRRIDDLEYTLDLIARCGYRGVEFAQHHSQIYLRQKDGSIRPIRDQKELLRHLSRRNLDLIGLVSGSLRERMNFLNGNLKPYLYLDRWPDNDSAFKADVEECLLRGHTLALHPHWLMQIRKLRHAIDIIKLNKIGKIVLLLDTAHATIAEDSSIEAVENPEYFELIGAVHLKDWRPDYGRWSHRYAHGFCLPGEGIVEPAKVVSALVAKQFSGWLILEQDHYSYRRESTILEGSKWLQKNSRPWGINIQIDNTWVNRKLREQRPNPFAKSSIFERKAYYFGSELSRSVSPAPDALKFYSVVVSTLRAMLKAFTVKFWSYNSVTGEFSLLGVASAARRLSSFHKIIRERKPNGTLSLAGEMILNPRTQELDICDHRITDCFEDRKWLKYARSHGRWMTILPIFNTSNKHQLRFLLTIFSDDSLLQADSIFEKSKFSPNDTKTSFEKMMRAGELDRLGSIIAHWADYLTDQSCSAASGATNYLCANFRGGVTEFIDALIEHLKHMFKCNSVTIFLKDPSGRKLEPAGRSDEFLEWADSDHFYTFKEGHTGEAFREREMVFDSRATTGRAREKRPLHDHRDEILFAPLVRQGGECHGVVRLHNKDLTIGSDAATMFTDEDAAKLDSVIQTALPYLELLILKENQTTGIARMSHELRTPLVAIRGAVDAMQTDFKRARIAPTDLFRRDFFQLILQFTEVVSRLANNWKAFTSGTISLPPIKHLTRLRSEVVVPVIHQIKGLLPNESWLEHKYEGFDQIPALWIDRDQFQQVFFNLLSNSCKYGIQEGGVVKVEIAARRGGKAYSIFYSDWGVGIQEEIQDLIFLPGYRGQSTAITNVTGQGLGLSVVKAIIESHGGTICVSSRRHPTTFRIDLPLALASNPIEH